MKIEIQTDESDETVKKQVKPIEFRSRGHRTRLLILVSALMLVLIGMNEARKPENWSWMGFDRNGKQLKTSEKSDEGSVVVRESQYDKPNAPDVISLSEPVDPDETSDVNQNEQTDILDGSAGVDSNEKELASSPVFQKDLDVLAAANRRDSKTKIYQPKFWRLLYGQLSVSERRLLFRTTWNLRNARTNNPSEHEQRGKLVEKIDSFAQTQSEDLLEKLSLLKTGSPTRITIDDQLQGFRRQWDSLSAAFGSDELPTKAQLADVHALQTILDVAALDDVEDRTRSGRPADDMAWLRIWETIFDPEFAEHEFPTVTPFQLKAQPEFYRGKPVSLVGELRGIHVIRTRNSLGIEVFYSIWMKHESSSIFPFNAYITELPSGIELEKDKAFTSFENENVKIDGVFFKVRTYADNGKTISQTPFILAKTLQMTGKTEVASLSVRSDFQITQTQWIVFLIGMPLLAGVIAYFAYRGTGSRRTEPGQRVAKQINDSLEQLTNDPKVQTVEEKLANLNRDEL